MGEGEKARRFHGEVLKIREAKLGKDHPDTIYSLFHLGNTEEDLQHYDKAVEYHQQALERAKEQLRQKQSIREYYMSKASMARALSRLKASQHKGSEYHGL